MSDINERLRQAAKDGAEAELKVLLMYPGCNALAKSDHGLTALMWASLKGNEACVKLLIPVSDALAKNKDGMTALMWAAVRGHETCVKILLPKSDALGKDCEGGRRC